MLAADPVPNSPNAVRNASIKRENLELLEGAPDQEDAGFNTPERRISNFRIRGLGLGVSCRQHLFRSSHSKH